MKLKNILAFFIVAILFSIIVPTKINAVDIIEGRFYIDNPTTNVFVGKTIKIQGWYLSNDINSTMKIYIDDKDTNAVVNQRIEREDVLNAILGYGGRGLNPKPGFEMTVDLSNYDYKAHKLKYVLVDGNNQEIVSKTINVTIDSRTKGKFCIDSPTQNVYEGKSIAISGWQMSTDASSTMKVYIDNQEVQTQITRNEREDVLKLITGYGDRSINPKPGFKIKIDLSNYDYKTYQIKYVLVDGKGKEQASQTKNITIDSRTKGRFCIDSPTQNVYEGKSIKVKGWQVSTDEKAQMKVYIDGQEAQTQIVRVERQDVLNFIGSGYGGKNANPKPGFEITIDLSSYDYKTHEIKYVLIDEQANVLSQQIKNVEIDSRTKGKFCIDSPVLNNNILTIKQSNINTIGWIMSTDENSIMKIYIDDIDTGATISKRIQREDVLRSISGYGGRQTNPNPGFEINLDITAYTIGEHTLKYVLLSSNGETMAEKTQKINIIKGQFYIDTPTRNTWDLKEFPITGWMMSVDKDAEFKVLINGTQATSNIIRTQREDVLNTISEYGGRDTNPNPGFEIRVDLSNYKKGDYDLTYLIESKTGEILAKQNKKITIDYTPKAKIYIDGPTSAGVENTNGKISGWIMTNVINPTINIYIDGQLRTEPQYRTARQDVLNSINGFGGRENNPNPGFAVNIDFGQFALGGHMLKVSVIDTEGREISSNLQAFNVIEQYKLESGTYGISGLGRGLRYYKIGNGPNVYFATFVVHGFEDKWAHDGQELTAIAESFKNRLVQDKDRGILSKWTIYIFPEVNPDGAQAGWSNDGPGRKTLYSVAPNNQGIDLNRCWSTGWYRMTGRNYNGTAPFQAPEAAYLRDFLLNHRATNGQTVLVDLHGWTTQLIGDGGICGYYANQFPSNKYTSSYGSGYLINWARSNLGANGRVARSALIELPSAGINNHQDVVNNNYAGRYIEATLSMLRGL